MLPPKKKSEEDGKKFLQDAFKLEQKLLAVKLEFSSKTITHAGTQGEVTENCFIEVLRKYLPNRYKVDTGIVIDSTGATSDQIDVIIYDPQYTPTLLDQQSHKYIPAEAVYAVLEVKPTIDKPYLEYAGKKAESVRKLKRTSGQVVHVDGVSKPKSLFNIIAGIVASKLEWADGFEGMPFQENFSSLKDMQTLDCGLAVSGGCFDVFEGKLKIKPAENCLAFFLFGLLKQLQSLGTVPAIDWDSYADALGKK